MQSPVGEKVEKSPCRQVVPYCHTGAKNRLPVYYSTRYCDRAITMVPFRFDPWRNGASTLPRLLPPSQIAVLTPSLSHDGITYGLPAWSFEEIAFLKVRVSLHCCDGLTAIMMLIVAHPLRPAAIVMELGWICPQDARETKPTLS